MPSESPAQKIRIPPTEWVLASGMVVLCAWAFVTQAGIESLITLSKILFTVSVLLTAVSLKSCFLNATPGRFLTLAGITYMYWYEGYVNATTHIPFAAIPTAMPYAFRFSNHHIAYAFLLISLFQWLFIAGYAFQPSFTGLSTRLAQRQDRTYPWLTWLMACLALGYYTAYLVPVGWNTEYALELMKASRSAAHRVEYAKEWSIPFYGVVSFVYLSMGATGYFWIKVFTTQGTQRLFSLAIATIGILPHIAQGARHIALYPLLCLVLVFFIGNHQRSVSNLFKRLTSFTVAALVIYTLLFAQSHFRGTGWTHNTQNFTQRLTQEKGAQTGQFMATLYALYLIPEFHGYFYEPITPFFFTHFIPRFIWPTKPIPESWTYYNQAYTRGQAFNVTPSVVGQFYINWSFWGPLFIGLWMGFLAAQTDKITQKIRQPGKHIGMITALGLFYAFLACSLRYYNPVYFTYTAYGWALVALATKSAAKTARITPTRALSDQPWPSSNSASTTLPA
jgi:hypothetical protein